MSHSQQQQQQQQQQKQQQQQQNMQRVQCERERELAGGPVQYRNGFGNSSGGGGGGSVGSSFRELSDRYGYGGGLLRELTDDEWSLTEVGLDDLDAKAKQALLDTVAPCLQTPDTNCDELLDRHISALPSPPRSHQNSFNGLTQSYLHHPPHSRFTDLMAEMSMEEKTSKSAIKGTVSMQGPNNYHRDQKSREQPQLPHLLIQDQHLEQRPSNGGAFNQQHSAHCCGCCQHGQRLPPSPVTPFSRSLDLAPSRALDLAPVPQAPAASLVRAPAAQPASTNTRARDIPPSPYLRPRIPPPSNPADQNPPCNTLYVGNLTMASNEVELREFFESVPGYKQLVFRTKSNGPMCFVEFIDIAHSTDAMYRLYGTLLRSSTKDGVRLSYSKNPLGVRGPPRPPNPPGARWVQNDPNAQQQSQQQSQLLHPQQQKRRSSHSQLRPHMF